MLATSLGVADFKSEWPRSTRNQWPTSFRNRWPTFPGIRTVTFKPRPRQCQLFHCPQPMRAPIHPATYYIASIDRSLLQPNNGQLRFGNAECLAPKHHFYDTAKR
jgi:hypothetical protein